jgi:hypothetical protein
LGPESNHTNIGGFAKAFFDQMLGMTDHALTFFAFDEKDPFAAFEGAGDKVMQAVCDEECLFFGHRVSLILMRLRQAFFGKAGCVMGGVFDV